MLISSIVPNSNTFSPVALLWDLLERIVFLNINILFLTWLTDYDTSFDTVVYSRFLDQVGLGNFLFQSGQSIYT